MRRMAVPATVVGGGDLSLRLFLLASSATFALAPIVAHHLELLHVSQDDVDSFIPTRLPFTPPRGKLLFW